ncbi:ABC transporter permease subunit [Micromonospora sp. NBC_01796]|uniref:ABC transporter permease subunit n=1 Tax=Micromonospora sp. NBC_01796 TaxID=2975987 RepID=UPI002DDA3335|nr:ABC transporter permease subunit [Micromonospora sp. NBC_01796]WSA84776.1 ABC transporter permease [Micromonospora sp. NBC_01796]
MTWMTWRQFRAQAVVGGVALAATAIYLVTLGVQIRHGYDADLVRCHGRAGGCGSLTAEFVDRYRGRLQVLGALLVVVPGFLGMFWGAPLIARELETGTHRLVWNQSVTRRRWLATKLLLVGLASMAAAGLSSLLLTWAASPYDLVAGDRFTALQFGARNIAPVAYAAFAFVLGAIVGLTARRTVPAMALTAVLFALVQVAVPTLIRPHLIPPVTGSHQVTAETVRNLSFLGSEADIGGLRISDAWVVSTSKLLTADGQPVELDRYRACVTGVFDAVAECMGNLDLRVDVAYQPGERYWDFQWLESAIFLGLAVMLAGLGLWRIQGRLP